MEKEIPVLQTKTWEQVYNECNHQLDNLKFYEVEIRFLNRLMEEYFTKMMQQEKLPEIKIALQDLNNLNKERVEIVELLTKHKKDIQLLEERITEQANNWVMDQEETLHMKFKTFHENYKKTKTEIFYLAEHILRTNKTKNLLK